MNGTPREIDERLAALHEQAAKLNQVVASRATSIYHASGARRTYARRGQGSTWDMDFAEAVATVRKTASDSDLPWKAREAREALDSFHAASKTLAEATAEIDAQNRLYTGWTRFFVVPGGHIHSSRSCSTCYSTTAFGWLPYLSGKTEAEALAHFGPAAECLCSVCFPSAPVADRNLTQKQTDALLAGQTPEATPVKTYCPGSGQRSATPVNLRRAYPQAKCPACGHVGAATSNGLVRKHQAK